VATSNAFWTTVNSATAHGTAAIDNVVDYGIAQLDYFTGIPFAAKQSVTPQRSVASLPNLDPAATTPVNIVKDTVDKVVTAAEDVTDAARARIAARQAERAERRAAAVGAIETGIARAQGEVRDAAADPGKALRPAKADKFGATDVGKPIRKAAQDARKAAKEARKAARSAHAGTSG
jgi:hypothetical protein